MNSELLDHKELADELHRTFKEWWRIFLEEKKLISSKKSRSAWARKGEVKRYPIYSPVNNIK